MRKIFILYGLEAIFSLIFKEFSYNLKTGRNEKKNKEKLFKYYDTQFRSV